MVYKYIARENEYIILIHNNTWDTGTRTRYYYTYIVTVLYGWPR